MHSLDQGENLLVLMHIILGGFSTGYILAEIMISYIKYKVHKEIAKYPAIQTKVIYEDRSDILRLTSVAEVSAKDQFLGVPDIKQRTAEHLKQGLLAQVGDLIQVEEDSSKYGTPNTVLTAELQVLKPRKGAE